MTGNEQTVRNAYAIADAKDIQGPLVRDMREDCNVWVG
jgi:hypothetical protein